MQEEPYRDAERRKDASPTLTALREENWRTCASKGAERGWFCNADDFEDAVVALESEAEALAEALERVSDLRRTWPASAQALEAYRSRHPKETNDAA